MANYYGKETSNTPKVVFVTDPALNAAVSTAIVNSYEMVLVTLTGAGNAQTIQTPAVATIKTFTVVNNDISTNSIVVNGITIPPGKAQSFIWDGTAWGPIDIGITSLPVPINQGGTGQVTAGAAMNALGVPSAAAQNDFILAGASPFAWIKKTLAEVLAIIMPSPGPIGETTPNTIRGKNKEIFKTASADSPLTAASCSGTIVSNYGMTDADCVISLPTAEEGYSFLLILPKVRARYFKLRAAAPDMIVLGGVAGSDNGYVGVASGYGAGVCCSVFTFATGVGAYDWSIIPIVGAWVAS